MRKYEAFLTNNGNIAVVVREEDNILYCAFITPKGEWLREATYQEFENIAQNAMFLVKDAYLMEETFETYLPEHAPIWEFVGSIRVEEDYSSYKPETGCNGGDYAFYTSLDVYHSMINGKSIIRGVTRYSTSAEFEYDELSASFQINLTCCEVLNTNYQYIIGNEIFNKTATYSTQGYETAYLEQISKVYKLEDINTMICKVIDRDDNNEIVESCRILGNIDDIVAKLIIAGASFAPASRNQRRG